MNFLAKLLQVCREEFGLFDPQTRLATLLSQLLPDGLGARIRAQLYRRCGMDVGAESMIAGALTLGSARGSLQRIRLGRRCFVNREVFIDAAAPVTLGNGVALGHHVVIITTDHALGPPHYRAGEQSCAPVTIGDGAWIAAGVTLLPGVTVGAGAVVAAGAVVTRDVPPNSLVGGVPARVIRWLMSGNGDAGHYACQNGEGTKSHERAAVGVSGDHRGDPHLQPEGEPAEDVAGLGASTRRIL